MQFSQLSVAALFTLFASVAIAAPAPADAVADVEARAAAEAADIEKRGFGCPGDQQKCHDHCKSVEGQAGGYCDAWTAYIRCTCY
ncbi:hypothetical protein CC79DRAFT_1372610 [Sarocladium strictum]